MGFIFQISKMLQINGVSNYKRWVKAVTDQ